VNNKTGANKMAKWAITYNGFGSAGDAAEHLDWSHVNVQSVKSSPVFSDDGISIETTRHVITGTALISKTTDANFRSAVLNARALLAAHPRKGASTAVKVYLDSETVATDVASGIHSATQTDGLQGETDEFTGGSEFNVVTYYGMDEDDYGLPTCDFSIEEIVGTSTAVVSFTITWHKYEPPAAGLTYDVISHTWTQEYTIDEAGMTTLVVDGQLRTRNYVDGRNASTGTTRGTNPDKWRTLVMPAVPDNFRVDSMRWATDTSGSKLLYRITLKEYARPLPFPAKRGSGSFVYKRSVDSGMTMLGTKVFTGELEGDTNSDPRELLNSLIRIAASRIFFGSVMDPGGGETGKTPDRIMSITVGEEDIFTKKKIKLQIIAQGMQTTSPFGTTGGAGQGTGFNLMDPFFSKDGLGLAERPNAYGSQMISSVKRQLFLPFDPDNNSAWANERAFPQATWRTANEWNGDDVALVADDETVSDAIVEATDGEHINAPIDETEHSKNPYVLVSADEHIEMDTNVIVMPGQSMTAHDVPFQISKPTVKIVSEYKFSRVGLPPKRFMLSKPENGVTLEENFNVNRGEVDANNNRNYLASYRRVVQLLDNGTTASTGFYASSFNLPGWGTVEMKAWWPQGGTIQMPVDPRVEGGLDETTGSLNRTLLSGENVGEQSSKEYKLGNSPKLYGED